MQINPLRSAKHARAILEVFLVSRAGLSSDDAQAKVRALKVSDYLELLTQEEEDADLPTQFEDGFPQSADEPSTAT